MGRYCLLFFYSAHASQSFLALFLLLFTIYLHVPGCSHSLTHFFRTCIDFFFSLCVCAVTTLHSACSADWHIRLPFSPNKLLRISPRPFFKKFTLSFFPPSEIVTLVYSDKWISGCNYLQEWMQGSGPAVNQIEITSTNCLARNYILTISVPRLEAVIERFMSDVTFSGEIVKRRRRRWKVTELVHTCGWKEKLEITDTVVNMTLK